MTNYQKTSKDLKEDLDDQIWFLRSSCDTYDAGKIAEAKRMAVHLRILLLDKGRNTHSLLSQLDIKERLAFHSHFQLNEHQDQLVIFGGLIMRLSTEGMSFAPNLQKPEYKLPFEVWWGQVINKSSQVTVTRSMIVTSVADMDGGAHVDPLLRGGYASLARNNGIGWRKGEHGPNGEEIDLGPLEGKHELMFVRQIAHEVLCTLDEQLPAFV